MREEYLCGVGLDHGFLGAAYPGKSYRPFEKAAL
jgi:hypothetical protein